MSTSSWIFSRSHALPRAGPDIRGVPRATERRSRTRPEWRLAPGQQHMVHIGSVDSAEINEVVAYLTDLVQRHDLHRRCSFSISSAVR